MCLLAGVRVILSTRDRGGPGIRAPARCHVCLLAELTDGTFTVELESVSVEGDDKAVATHRSRAQRAGKTLDQDEFLTYTFAGGKISRIVESQSDPAAYDEFWS